MPKLMNTPDTDVQQTVSQFGFSAKRPDALQGTQYTLVDIEVDESSSVYGFRDQLVSAVQKAVGALKKSPCVDRVLVRTAKFNGNLNEIHGFIPLSEIDESKYAINPGGSTALLDATVSGIEALGAYGETLDNLEYDVNALEIVITDGGECASRTVRSNGAAKTKITAVRNKEHLESIKSILIGVGDPDAECYDNGGARVTFKTLLERYRDEVGFDQLVMIGDATEDNLAKMGGFISRSVSSSSQALNTGGPSKNLTF